MVLVRSICAVLLVTAVPAVVSAQCPVQEPREFGLRLEIGKSFYTRITTKEKQKIKVMDSELAQTQESTVTFKWTPVQNIGNKWVLTDEIVAVKFFIDISGNMLTFDSDNSSDAEGASPQFRDFFKKIVGIKLTVTLDEHMRVERVDGVREFIKSLSSGNPSLDAVLKSIVTEDTIEKMCDPDFGLLPDGPKRPGEKWSMGPQAMSVGPIGSFLVTYNYTLAGIGNQHDRIEVAPMIEYRPPAKDTESELLFRIKERKFSSSPSDKGVILYNRILQRIDLAEIAISLNGELTVVIGASETRVNYLMTQTVVFQTSDSPDFSKPRIAEPVSTPVVICQPLTCPVVERRECPLRRLFLRRFTRCR